MAKIQEVAGVIGEALRLRPEIVQAHLEGLRVAQRITSDDIGPVEAADLLAACICTDPVNATGAYHLPFVGAECSGNYVEPSSPEMDAYRCNAGQALAMFLDPKELHFGCASDITISGEGTLLRAAITATSPEVGRVRLWFGYDALPFLIGAKLGIGVFQSRTIGSAVVHRVGQLFSKYAMPDSRPFLNAALRSNTPAKLVGSVH